MVVNEVEFVETLPRRKRVAAYGRVSTSKDTMLHSLSAQVSYYSSLIQNHSEWEYAGVYSDEGISGTKNDRPAFQSLMQDCRNGKIDIIIVKSISRFARNTITLLNSVRELKELGVDVYFEEQNIHTLSSSGEVMLTVLGSIAQEEAKSVSENCRWRIHKKFEAGIPNTFKLYGYRKVNGNIVIEPNEAAVVQEIFSLCISGFGSYKISNILQEENIKLPNKTKWSAGRIREILKNEKYTGNMLLQKYYNKDYMTKQSKRNRGELPKYYVEETHPAIISKEEFDEVATLLKERDTKHVDAQSNAYDFKSIVFCGCCGWRCKRKKNHEKYVWKCVKLLQEGAKSCRSKQIPDDTLHELANGINDISKVIILQNNHVKFILTSGDEILKEWKPKSRSESWTDDMKAEARKKTIERSEQNAKSNKN